MIDVLIIDDDPMVAEINRGYLSEIEGYRLKGLASSVKEALDFIEKNQVNLVLLDIYMPEVDGLHFLMQIRQLEKDIDVILITAASDMKSVHKAFQYGAVDYILKPFRFDRFKQALVKYREQSKALKKDSKISQDELDQLLLEKRTTVVKAELPKGLSKNTLREIWLYLNKKKGEDFSTEELVDVIGISRISIRKYLSFLEKIGAVASYCSYGNIGRPLTIYQCKQENQKLIEPYLMD